MSEIYAKIYMEDENTLVLEGKGTEDKPHCYYPTQWEGRLNAEKRIHTTVIGKEHISITQDAKAAIRRIFLESHPAKDPVYFLDIFHTGISKTNDICIRWVGDVVSRWNVEEAIADPEFFVGDKDRRFDLAILDELTE